MGKYSIKKDVAKTWRDEKATLSLHERQFYKIYGKLPTQDELKQFKENSQKEKWYRDERYQKKLKKSS